MNLSSVAVDLFGAAKTTPKNLEHRYDLRLEVGVQDESGTVPLAAIFHDLIRKMKSVVEPDKPLAVYTATNKVFLETQDLTSDEFKQAFKVTQSTGKQSKVLLGFKLKTATSLSQLKQRLLRQYLIPHDLFLREHVGGFEEGLQIYSFGFLKNDHPDHPDIPKATLRFEKLLGEAWKKLDKDSRVKWKDAVPAAFHTDRLKVPITFSKERVSAEIEGKPKIATTVLMVQTPKKFGPLLRELLDVAILGKKITNLIPLAFSREDPNGYYHLIAAQERFMEQHRNIPIQDVPTTELKTRGTKGETLDQVLYSNKFIQRVSHEPKTNRYHVSTIASKYREVHNWIQQALEEHSFSYKPSLRPLKFSHSGSTFTKYSAVFADAVSTANDSFDASSFKTTKSNPWKQRPPLDISYVPTDEAFPPLSPSSKPTTATPFTASETADEDTIQSAISNAIRTLQEQHRQEMDALKQQFEQRLETIEKKLLDVGIQVVQQTYQALVSEDTPLATKADQMGLQHQVNSINAQLTQIIGILQNSPVIQRYHAESVLQMNSTPPRTGKRPNQNRTPEKHESDEEFFTQDTPVPSATSNQDEGMEGCED